jgi:transposase
MGRSRRRSTIKIHVVADAQDRPLRLKLTEGQAHGGRSAVDMLDSIGADEVLLADRGYDADQLREAVAMQGAIANIRPMPNRKRIPRLTNLYRLRNHAEQFFSKIKQFRAVATRYDKRDDTFPASVQLASKRIWLRTYELVT